MYTFGVVQGRFAMWDTMHKTQSHVDLGFREIVMFDVLATYIYSVYMLSVTTGGNLKLGVYSRHSCMIMKTEYKRSA